MWAKIWRSLQAELPANNMAIQSRKFPAAIPESGIFGWLCQWLTGFGHFGLQQVLVTIAFVLICLASTDVAKVKENKQLR